jgi:Family of unknown function (DUF7010)
MLITEAQHEVRSIYEGGFFGQLISSILWLTAAALGTWLSARAAILTLVVGGFFIFPSVMALLRLLGRAASLPVRNPLRYLAMQVAFVLPLSMPLVAPVAIFRLHWFFPAMMVLVGAHYLPFTFLYGMRSFILLSVLLVGAGLAIALWFPATFSLGGWAAGLLLLVFAVCRARRSCSYWRAWHRTGANADCPLSLWTV